MLNTEGSLYYEAYRPALSVGAVVISHGYCESAEKYKEVIYYFTQAGYEVYIAEHRGHGRSFRETPHPNMVHVSDFNNYVTDLHTFINTIVKPHTNDMPLYLFAHSMGGAIGALYLETYPETFTRAILSAPMLALSMKPFPVPWAMALGRIMICLHRDGNYAPGQHAFSPGRSFEKSGSSCPERFYYYQEKRESSPCFQNSGSSYGWAYRSLNACRFITQKRNCDKITVPILVFRSLYDGVVEPSGILRFVKNTPSSRLIAFDGSRHEIYNSPAAILENYYQEIFKFLTET
ncbi:MAG: alpha/beta hydrolase [Lachnospiraceae bacterium]|nr:alpha/beta hydrolase [Lachnospiraceae bacterium]MDE6185476.1 alpha/beta hydrolase [Lachnospiraceae bacterium]